MTGRWFPDRREPVAELVRWTGAPASVARVVDSDCAIVTGLAPGGRPWRTALHIDSVADYAEHEPEALLLPEGTESVFVEETFDDVLAEPGFPTPGNAARP